MKFFKQSWKFALAMTCMGLAVATNPANASVIDLVNQGLLIAKSISTGIGGVVVIGGFMALAMSFYEGYKSISDRQGEHTWFKAFLYFLVAGACFTFTTMKMHAVTSIGGNGAQSISVGGTID